MLHLKRVFCIVTAVVMLLGCFGCASGETPDNDSAEHRQPFEQPDKTVYEDTDGQFDYNTVKWDGPEGYKIVVPAGNASLKKTATLLTEYYKGIGLTLSVITDAAAPSDKEILIGSTNRSESKKDLSEAELSVSVSGKKLVFSAGHDVTVDSAVKKFIRLAPNKNEAFTFDIKTDFVSTS